ncbi:hypothetical protein KGF54_000741 [Candida jiufengensis]|uniref:uncharacterized protein n=1 Tax=Candida jiufengensis TaxID=497108 RepID=UPI0022248C8C|nr:uncharacterized protein KGF54_000741 [Candida jiufengensis]KAI5956266.1 hypothetical protein KGF54_000741 [Candida jiufengensis]
MAPNRREEIKKKQELQAKFQFSIAQNNNLALNWLKPKTQEHQNSTNDTTQDEFLKLKVIPNGKSLNSSSSDNLQTIEDFLNSKDINNLKETSNNRNSNNNQQQNQNGSTTSRNGGGGSIAMKALLNKMRNETRNKSQNLQQQPHLNLQKLTKNSTPPFNNRNSRSSMSPTPSTKINNSNSNQDSDSDDPDRDAIKSRSVKSNNSGIKSGKIARAQQDEYATDPNIFELTSKNFDTIIHGTNHTSIVKFYAPWCGYCQQLKPVWTKLGKVLGSSTSKINYNIASVNCDKSYNKQLCSSYQISGFPTIMVFRPPKYDPSKPPTTKKRHASEVYTGERSIKSITNFLNSRLKNYVKKLHNYETDLINWFKNKEDSKHKILLITNSNSISPLFKSLAIDFISQINFAIINKLNSQPAKIGELVIPISEKSSLVYLNTDKSEIQIYNESEKLNDRNKIEEWIIKVSGIEPVEGNLSKKGKKLLKYKSPTTKNKKKNKVEHDEL